MFIIALLMVSSLLRGAGEPSSAELKALLDAALARRDPSGCLIDIHKPTRRQQPTLWINARQVKSMKDLTATDNPLRRDSPRTSWIAINPPLIGKGIGAGPMQVKIIGASKNVIRMRYDPFILFIRSQSDTYDIFSVKGFDELYKWATT